MCPRTWLSHGVHYSSSQFACVVFFSNWIICFRYGSQQAARLVRNMPKFQWGILRPVREPRINEACPVPRTEMLLDASILFDCHSPCSKSDFLIVPVKLRHVSDLEVVNQSSSHIDDVSAAVIVSFSFWNQMEQASSEEYYNLLWKMKWDNNISGLTEQHWSDQLTLT